MEQEIHFHKWAIKKNDHEIIYFCTTPGCLQTVNFVMAREEFDRLPRKDEDEEDESDGADLEPTILRDRPSIGITLKNWWLGYKKIGKIH